MSFSANRNAIIQKNLPQKCRIQGASQYYAPLGTMSLVKLYVILVQSLT